MPTAESPNPYMCETTDYTVYAILISKTNNCHGTRSRNVLYILFFAVDFSQQKRAKLLARRATPEHPAFTLINLILPAQ